MKSILWCGIGVLVAAGLCVALSPPQVSTRQLWDMRASLFTSLLTCQCFLVLTTVANRLGLQRKDHVLTIGLGLAIWGAIALASNSIRVATGWHKSLPIFNGVTMVVYVAVTVYWSFSLWSEQRQLKPVNTEMISSVFTLLTGKDRAPMTTEAQVK